MTPREFFRSRSSISLGVSPGTTYSAGTADQMLPRNCWTETGAKAITRSRKNGANRAKTSASQFHEEYSYYSGNAVCNPQVLPAFSAIKSVEEGICFVNQARHILPPRCWEEMVEHSVAFSSLISLPRSCTRPGRAPWRGWLLWVRLW